MAKSILQKRNLFMCALVVFFSFQFVYAQTSDGGPSLPDEEQEKIDEDKINRILELSHGQPTASAINEIIAMDLEGSDNPVRQQFSMTALIQLGPSKVSDLYVQFIVGQIPRKCPVSYS